MIDEAQANQQICACGDHLPRIYVSKYPRVARVDPSRAPAAVQGHTAPITFPRKLNAAIKNWPKRATAIVELIAGRLAATTAIHKRTKLSRPPKTTRPTPLPEPRRPLEGRPMDPFGVIAKMHQRPARARWAFQGQRSVGSMTASSPTDEYPGMVR